jgi:LysM repeat protein
VAALVYGLDSAIKGEKFSDIALKAGGAGATAWAGGKLFGSDPNAFDPGSGTGWDASQTPGGPADTNALSNVNQMGDYNGDYVNMPDGSDTVSPLVAPPPELATYTVQPLDNLSKIADRFNTSVAELKGLNPQLAAASGATGGQGMNVDVIFPGQQITLPPGTPGMDVYAGGVGTNANTMADIASGQVPDSAITQGMAAKGQAAADAVSGRADNLANMAQQAGSVPIDYSQTGPISTDSLGHKLEYGIPVTDTGNFVPPNPGLPADELAKQTAAYNSWKADFMKRNPNIYINADGNQMQIPGRITLPAAVQESVKFRIIPASRLIDQKATVLSWALNESVGRRSKSVNLTTIGTYTVFENVDRYRQALLEYTSTQPGRPELPDQYAPAMSGGAGVKSEPGMIGRGLNWLDRGVKKVGGALSNFGHQFTTNVTKEKLKMNWHQAGKPSDSDQLAAWLVKQGVPQPVVTSVFGKMGIPYTAPAAQATTQPAAPVGQTTAPAVGGAQRTSNSGSINPATGREYTGDEIRAKHGFTDPVPASDSTTDTVPGNTAPSAVSTPGATAPAGGKFPGEDPQGPGYVGRREAARRQAARDADAAKKPAAPNFAQQGGGYKSVNYAPNIKTGINLPKPTAPAGTKVTAGGPTADEKAKLDQRIAQALKQPVAEMLQMVETKEDVQKIKQFVDDTFIKYGAVNESAFAVRNQILEHVTQVGAQRRREHGQRVAH